MNKILHTKKRYMSGFTMIEILITLVILSIGLLGMAGLQLTSIRTTNSSGFRTQAILMANNMVERMRANPAAMDNNQFIALNSGVLNCAALPVPYCEQYYDLGAGGPVAAQACNTDQMANYDFDVWFCGVAATGGRQGGLTNAMQQATATITCNDTDPISGPDGDPCTNGSPHVITIGWTEQNPDTGVGAPADVVQTLSMTVQP